MLKVTLQVLFERDLKKKLKSEIEWDLILFL
jgi:hypothetical protein